MTQCKYEMLRPCHIWICPPLHSTLCQGTDTISTFDILSLAVTDRVVFWVMFLCSNVGWRRLATTS